MLRIPRIHLTSATLIACAVAALVGCASDSRDDLAKDGAMPETVLDGAQLVGMWLDSAALCDFGGLEVVFDGPNVAHALPVQLAAGDVLDVSMVGRSDFDSVLALYGPFESAEPPPSTTALTPLVVDDDSGDGLLSAIDGFVSPASGHFALVVSTFAGNSQGSLLLQMTVNGSVGCADLSAEPLPDSQDAGDEDAEGDSTDDGPDASADADVEGADGDGSEADTPEVGREDADAAVPDGDGVDPDIDAGTADGDSSVPDTVPDTATDAATDTEADTVPDTETDGAGPDVTDAAEDPDTPDTEPDTPDSEPDAVASCSPDIDCDDGIACTIDSCHPETGCTYAVDPSACPGGQVCAPFSPGADALTGCAVDTFCTVDDPLLEMEEDGFVICTFDSVPSWTGPDGAEPGALVADCPIRLAAPHGMCSTSDCQAARIQTTVRYDADRLSVLDFYEVVEIIGVGEFEVTVTALSGGVAAPTLDSGFLIATSPSTAGEWDAQGYGGILLENPANPSAPLTNAFHSGGGFISGNPEILRVAVKQAGPITISEAYPARICLASTVILTAGFAPLDYEWDEENASLVTCTGGTGGCIPF